MFEPLRMSVADNMCGDSVRPGLFDAWDEYDGGSRVVTLRAEENDGPVAKSLRKEGMCL